MDEIHKKFNGRYLAVDKNPEILEGNWSYDRIVIIEFRNEKELKHWYDTKEYKDILEYRLRAGRRSLIPCLSNYIISFKKL